MKPAVRFVVLALGVALASTNAVRSEESAEKLLQQASEAAAKGDSAEADRLATLAIKQNDKLSAAYYLRGRERFRLVKIKESVADFDRYVKLRPDAESRQWERGIADYYAKQYKKGAKQFELYQTFHDNDVENSVWRYLCMVPDHGIEKSRAVMLPIKNDRRVPMMQVYELYRGNLKPEEVLAECRRDEPDEEVLAGRLFYAHLYLGLYHEVAGEKKLAEKYITLAADKKLADSPRINRYMWDVARIHSELMKQSDQ